MAAADEENSDAENAPLVAGTLVGNGGEPIALKNVELEGFAAEDVQPKLDQENMVQIWRRLAITSDHPGFFRLAEGFTAYVQAKVTEVGAAVLLSQANAVLLVVKPDKTAELWVDAAATAVQMRARRPLRAGEVVFTNDIVDVTGLNFPMVRIDPGDSVVYLFREGWRFGLYFDFEGIANTADLSTHLGTLFRGLAYRHVYDSVADANLMDRLIGAGWFPFAEIVANDGNGMLRACGAGFDLAEEEAKLLALFTRDRLENILARWLTKPPFRAKEKLLRSAIDAFLREDPISTIKTLITEIEGIVCDAHEAVSGTRAKLGPALEFAMQNAEMNAGTPFSLMFPREFARYLKQSVFADFDPQTGTGDKKSRHAVGHGAAPVDAYTMERALQVILTLDQFAFYV